MAIFLWLLRDLGLLALLGSRRPMTAKRASQIAPRRAKRHPRGPQDGSGGPRDGPRGPQQRSRDLVHSSRSNPLPLLFSCSVPRGYGKAPHPDARHLGQTPRPAGRGSALVSYNAGISACEKGQQWWWALALLSNMWEAKLEPNVISYNAGISACENGEQWQRALSLLSEMQETMLKPDVISFTMQAPARARRCWAPNEPFSAWRPFFGLRGPGGPKRRLPRSPGWPGCPKRRLPRAPRRPTDGPQSAPRRPKTVQERSKSA